MTPSIPTMASPPSVGCPPAATAAGIPSFQPVLLALMENLLVVGAEAGDAAQPARAAEEPEPQGKGLLVAPAIFPLPILPAAPLAPQVGQQAAPAAIPFDTATPANPDEVSSLPFAAPTPGAASVSLPPAEGHPDELGFAPAAPAAEGAPAIPASAETRVLNASASGPVDMQLDSPAIPIQIPAARATGEAPQLPARNDQPVAGEEFRPAAEIAAIPQGGWTPGSSGSTLDQGTPAQIAMAAAGGIRLPEKQAPRGEEKRDEFRESPPGRPAFQAGTAGARAAESHLAPSPAFAPAPIPGVNLTSEDPATPAGADAAKPPESALGNTAFTARITERPATAQAVAADQRPPDVEPPGGAPARQASSAPATGAASPPARPAAVNQDSASAGVADPKAAEQKTTRTSGEMPAETRAATPAASGSEGRRSESAPQRPVAPPSAPPEQGAAPAPARNLQFRVGSPGERVEVRVAERGGEVRVTVRTPDSQLASSLGERLPELVDGLGRSGFQAEAWRPSANAGGPSGDPAYRGGGQGHSQGHGQGGGQQQQRRDSDQPRWWEEWTRRTGGNTGRRSI